MRPGRLLAPALSLLFCCSACCGSGEDSGKGRENQEVLIQALHALSIGLQYMEDRVSEINLDGAFGSRLIEDVFQSFLESRPDIFELEVQIRHKLDLLRVKADRIARAARPYLQMNNPEYFATLGGLLDRSEVTMWYPGRLTRTSQRMPPLPCSDSAFNETLSDQCLSALLGSREDRSDACRINQECLDIMTKSRQRGYMITHQVLYFQIMEMRGCLVDIHQKIVPKSFQDELCSNVMRDAEEIVRNDYPLNHRDLFMEQIGLCGMWGYRDFYKQEWLREILQWQQESGCFTNRIPYKCEDDLSKLKIREKREEKILSDGCLSHKTTVALLAIATNIRFIIEDIFYAI